MRAKERENQVFQLIKENGFLTVSDLSRAFAVSEMTIRRDLEKLDHQKRIRRIYGGAVVQDAGTGSKAASSQQGNRLTMDSLDAIIAASVSPNYDTLLTERADRLGIPIIAESLSMPNQKTSVAVNNYEAGYALGEWAGNYTQKYFGGRAFVFDLTYHLSNTVQRSRGFMDGLTSVNPDSKVVLSMNGQHRYDIAYQMTLDALDFHPEINLIFAVNDIMAWGAYQACLKSQKNPEQTLVLPFGLEGNTMRSALSEGGYCKAGLAMFPEIVAPVSIEAAISAWNGEPLPEMLITPHSVITTQNLSDYYSRSPSGWQLNWPAVKSLAGSTLNLFQAKPETGRHCLRNIGFITPYSDHEWYQCLESEMRAYGSSLNIQIHTIDAQSMMRDELVLRRKAIARCAASSIQPGDVILLDSGEITESLAEELINRTDLTVITNSNTIFETLKNSPGISLVCTGGTLRRSAKMLVGPITENALRELRAEKLFINANWISTGFGLSHNNISEASVKQAMVRSARSVILLADHTCFGQESIIQIAPPGAIHQIISDDALPTFSRLEWSKMGVQITIAAITEETTNPLIVPG